VRLQFAVILALASAALGCASTTLGGSEARVPVLLGPVPCIGCAPGSATRVTPATMPAGSLRKDLVCPFCVPLVPGPAYVGNWEHATAFKRHADYLGAPGCGGALQLTSLRARAWTFAIPPFFWYTGNGVDGEVTAVRASEGRCSP
jgi:hypothetical protein